MYNTQTLPWGVKEWEHPAAKEYHAVVNDIVKYWQTNPKPTRPDLQTLREHATEEPAVNYRCQLNRGWMSTVTF